jgi:hypothetical protein
LPVKKEKRWGQLRWNSTPMKSPGIMGIVINSEKRNTTIAFSDLSFHSAYFALIWIMLTGVEGTSTEEIHDMWTKSKYSSDVNVRSNCKRDKAQIILMWITVNFHETDRTLLQLLMNDDIAETNDCRERNQYFLLHPSGRPEGVTMFWSRD